MPNLDDDLIEKRAGFMDGDTVPLLRSYGAVSGLSKRLRGNGMESNVLVVEIGNKKVFITDVKNAKGIISATKDAAKLTTQQLAKGNKNDDTLALVVPQEGSEGYTVQELQQPSDTSKESLDHKLVREFVQFIQSFGSNEGDGTTSPWRFRAPVIVTAVLLLLTMLAMLTWTLAFRGGFGFDTPTILFNFHPVLMITGFIFFSGYAMLFYRGLTWLEQPTVKTLHAVFQFLALVSILLGFIAVKQSVEMQFPDRPQFVTLHSWLGIITISLMSKQYISAFFAFIVGYYRYRDETATLRAKLVPYHTTIGLITFVLAAATAVAGLTEKAIFSLSDMYILFTAEEAPYINAVGLFIVAAAIAMVFTLRDDRTKRSNQPNIYFIDNFK